VQTTGACVGGKVGENVGGNVGAGVGGAVQTTGACVGEKVGGKVGACVQTGGGGVQIDAAEAADTTNNAMNNLYILELYFSLKFNFYLFIKIFL